MNPSFRQAFRLLCWEASFAMAYEAWIGPTYLGGLAGELGVNVLWVSFITALPWVGLVGQLIGFFAFARARSVRGFTVLLAGGARASWSIPLVFGVYWGLQAIRGGEAFPAERWFAVTGLSALVSSLLGSSSAISWMTWIRGLIPSAFQGRFFGVRQRYTMAALISANLLASVLIGLKPNGYRLGPYILCTLALVSAAVSTFVLARVPDLKLRQPERLRPSWRLLSEPFRDAPFARLIAYGALFNASIQVAGPYFGYFFTKELQIPMGTIALWAMMTNLGAFVASARWGKRVDRAIDPRSTLLITGGLIAVSPLPYLVPSAEAIRWIAPGEFLVNGIAWSGYNVAMTTLLFRYAPARKSALYFSVYQATTGILGAFFAFLGGQLSQIWADYGGFRALWIFASGFRVVALVVGYQLLSNLKVSSKKTQPLPNPI